MKIQHLRKISYIFFLFFVATTVALDGMLHTIYGPIMIAASPVVFGLIILLLLLGDKIPRFTNLHVLLFFYFFWTSLSYIWTTTPSDTAWRLFLLNFYFMIMVIIYWYSLESKVKLNKAYIAFFIFTIILALEVNNNFKLDIQDGSGRFTAFDLGSNEMSATLAIGVTLAFYLSNLTRNIAVSLLTLVGALVLINSTLLTGSKMGMGLIFIAASFGIYQILRKSIIEKSIILISFILSIQIIISKIPKQLIERLSSTAESVSTGNLNEREIIWEIGLEGFKDQPIFGRGVDSFGRLSNDFHLDLEAHNTYISILVEYGLIGFSVYLALLVGILFSIISLKGVDRFFLLALFLQILFTQMFVNFQDNTILWSLYALIISHYWLVVRNK